MAVVGTAEYLIEAPGLTKVERSLDRFGQTVDRSMDRSMKSTEKATKATKMQVLGFAALGAAVGVVFIDFLRKSTVLSTMTNTMGMVLGALADRILVRFVPAFIALIDVLADLTKEFNRLDPAAQDAAVSIGLVAIGIAAIVTAASPIVGVILLFAGLFLGLARLAEELDKVGIGFNEFVRFMEKGPAAFQAFREALITQVSDTLAQGRKDIEGFIGWWGQAFQDVGHVIQGVFGDIGGYFRDLGLDLAFTGVGIIGFFRDLWDRISLGAQVAWAIISNVFTGAWQRTVDVWNVAVAFFRDLWDRIFTAFKGPFNAFITGIELVLNVFSNAINSTFGLIPGMPHLGTITLPRLERGGTVERTGIAVVHEGETFFGAGSAPAVTVQVLIGAGALTSLALPESTSGLEDLFGALGQMAGERAATVLRRRD